MVRMPPGSEIRHTGEQCQLWISIEGGGTIGEEAFRAGEVWLLPESGGQPSIRAAGAARFLRTWVPG
jgi:hypothetical protein